MDTCNKVESRRLLMCTVYVLYQQSSAIYSGRLLKATPARVSRLVTATYDTSGMCGRGHCIAKKAIHKLIKIPQGRHIGNFVVHDLSGTFIERSSYVNWRLLTWFLSHFSQEEKITYKKKKKYIHFSINLRNISSYFVMLLYLLYKCYIMYCKSDS